MPNRKYQKNILLDIYTLLQTKTDCEHGLTVDQIQEVLLEKYNSIDRRTIYQDIRLLTEHGYKIIKKRKNTNVYYYHISTNMDLSEWKILVDAVQSSRFITEKQSKEIVSKIASYISVNEAKELKRYVYVQGRNKYNNEAIFQYIDIIHKAIRDNKRIVFKYFDWDINKNKVFHRNNEFYTMDPWSLSWQDENYYLICSEPQNNNLRHFRVDKMDNVRIEETLRTPNSPHHQFDEGSYTNTMFGMFSGTPCAVTLKVANELSGVIIDRFGKNLLFRKYDDSHFLTTVNVVPSPLFYGWALSFGAGIKIKYPENIVKEWKKQALNAITDD